MTEPTDNELTTFTDAFDWEGWISPALAKRAFARAVLARWGTPPAVAGEPDAYLHDDGYWTAAKTEAGRNLNDRLLFAGSPKVAVYTTPQPTRAQPVPLTDEQIKAAASEYYVDDFLDFKAGVRFAEQHHGIKGGQHGADETGA